MVRVATEEPERSNREEAMLGYVQKLVLALVEELDLARGQRSNEPTVIGRTREIQGRRRDGSLFPIERSP